MIFSKRRIIHAAAYEIILLILISIGLSSFFDLSVETAGSLGILMAIVAVIWNMVFNHYFEKLEKKRQWDRNIFVRILHAIGFEGGLIIFTVPMIAYMMDISLISALILDIGLTLCILVYTFIFQWCFDIVENKLGYAEKQG